MMLRIVFNVFSMMFAKTWLLFCCFCIWLFVLNCFCRSVWCYAKPRCNYSYRMLLSGTSMLLFVSHGVKRNLHGITRVRIWCYAKLRCYYSCPYDVMGNLDAIIRASNYVRLNPGLHAGAIDFKLIMPILPAERKFMLLSLAEGARKLSSNIQKNLTRPIWILRARN